MKSIFQLACKINYFSTRCSYVLNLLFFDYEKELITGALSRTRRRCYNSLLTKMIRLESWPDTDYLSGDGSKQTANKPQTKHKIRIGCHAFQLNCGIEQAANRPLKFP